MIIQKKIIPLLICILIDSLSFGMITLLLPKISSDMGATPFQITIIVISYTLTKSVSMLIIGNYYSGIISKMFPISFFLMAFTCLLYFFAFSWEYILLIRLSQGAWSGIAWLSAQTLLASGSETQKMGKNFGFFYGASNFGFIFGNALCGLFFSILTDYKMIFIYIAVLYCIAILFSLLIGIEIIPAKKSEIQKNVNKNYKILLISLIHNGSVAFLSSIILIFAYNYLKFDVTDMAGIIMIAGIFGIISRPVVGYLSDIVNELHIMILGFLFRIFSFLLIISTRDLQMLLIAAIFFTFATASVGTPFYTFVSRSVRKEDISSILSLVNVSGDIGRILLPLFGGIIYESFYPINSFIFVIIMNICIIPVVFSLKKYNFQSDQKTL